VRSAPLYVAMHGVSLADSSRACTLACMPVANDNGMLKLGGAVAWQGRVCLPGLPPVPWSPSKASRRVERIRAIVVGGEAHWKLRVAVGGEEAPMSEAQWQGRGQAA
jgi:hypothetical protein